ncbi:MAG: hypothetical protein M0R17_05460 [Candidatus Omnitrophica bacterium]|jgi:hypothetical protein|nr:hypothetical protein [Candidatus Omnitrophota bacterium]
MNKSKEEKKKPEYKLPKYLRLAKGSMWLDTEGEEASGVRLYSVKEVFVSRDMKFEINDGKVKVFATDVPKDRYNNNNNVDFGKVDSDLPWYVDTTTIDPSKLSHILTAYKHGILIAADPDKKPGEAKEKVQDNDFGYEKNGDRIFVGKNKEMFKKLQNLTFNKLKEFVATSPLTEASKRNLIDLYDYERKGYNALGRLRLEVVDLIRDKLKEYGSGMSDVRINED